MANQSSSIFQAWGSSTDQYGQRMRHQQIHHSMEGVDATLFTADSVQPIKKSYRIQSKYKPLCLRRVIFEIQQDFPSTQKDYSRTFSGDNSSSLKGLPNISDLRVTEIALQNATAYKQSSVLFRQPSQSSPPSLESILKEKITKSRKKWRHLTETGQYNKMWRSLGRDVQHRFGSRKGEKALESSTGQRNGRQKEELTVNKLKKTSNESLSTLSSTQDKNSNPSTGYRSARHVLPRIVLPLI